MSRAYGDNPPDSGLQWYLWRRSRRKRKMRWLGQLTGVRWLATTSNGRIFGTIVSVWSNWSYKSHRLTYYELNWSGVVWRGILRFWDFCCAQPTSSSAAPDVTGSYCYGSIKTHRLCHYLPHLSQLNASQPDSTSPSIFNLIHLCSSWSSHSPRLSTSPTLSLLMNSSWLWTDRRYATFVDGGWRMLTMAMIVVQEMEGRW